MGPAPTPPPPLGTAPRIGFPHPKFPTVGTARSGDPSGNYQSQIDTSSPFKRTLLDTVASTITPAPIRAFNAVGSTVAKSMAGDQSRQAFSRSLTDTSNNALRRSMDEFNTEYRGQAEKSLANDVLAQRQSVFDRYRMQVLADVFGADVLTGFDMKQKTLSAHYEREKKNSQAMVTAAILRMVGAF